MPMNSLDEKRLKHYFAVQYTKDGREYPFLNCWGLICEFYRRELNITLSLFTEYTPKTMTAGYKIAVSDFIPVDSPEFGDVVAFFTQEGILYHVGVMLSPDRFLHSDYRHNTQITPLSFMHNHHKIFRHRSRLC